MTIYTLSFTVSTDADPSLLLEALTNAAENFGDDLESMHDEPCTVHLEGSLSPSVEQGDSEQ